MNTFKSKASVLFLFLTLFSCKNESQKWLVTPSKMIDVLADIHIAEAAVEGDVPTMKDSIMTLYYAQIFDKNGVSKADFDSTFTIASRQPQRLQNLYKEVEKKLKLIDPSRVDSSKINNINDSLKYKTQSQNQKND